MENEGKVNKQNQAMGYNESAAAVEMFLVREDR